MPARRPRTAFCASLAGAALALVMAPAGAAAQPAPPPASPKPPAAPPVIVPPRPVTPIHADYPQGATGDAVVVLVITVASDGSVRGARVVDGAEPFASAAIAASAGWRFEPATRDDKPFAAAIRAEIRFSAPAPQAVEPAAPEKPPPVPAAPGAPKPPPPPEPASPPAQESLEVTVRGEAPAPGATTMTRAEVRLLPGAFGDPFRAVEALPGVTPIASGVPFFYVRGAPPGNVGYFLDGIRVPLLYHIGLGPSVVNPAIVDRVDLYPGGYPAQYGRFAGGIVAGETRDPNGEWHGEGNVRVVDAGAMVEGPLPKDGGTFFVGGRYSYTGALLSLISSSLSLAYWDYQARATVHLTPRDDLTVFAFGAHDFLGKKDGSETTTLFDTTFHRVDLRYDHRFGGPDDHLRVAATLGYDLTGFDKGAFVDDRIVGLRAEVTRRLSPSVLLRAGVDGQIDAYRADLEPEFGDAPGFATYFSDHTDLAVGARADAVIAVTPRLEVTPGLRFDFYGSVGSGTLTTAALDPRISARLAITPSVRLVQAYGLASQPPSFILPGPGFTPGLQGGLQHSVQTSAGVEVDLPGDVTASATVFRDAFFDMTDALGTNPAPGASGSSFPNDFARRSDGSSVGLEIVARRRLTRKLGGFLSYTLSRSVRTIGRSTFASAFDRTHVLNVAAVYDFGRGYKAGGRVVFYTGYPVTTPAPTMGGAVAQTGTLPPFFRLDVRLEKKWTIASRGWISLVLEVENATLDKETLQQSCELFVCSPVKIGPVTIPSLGVEGGF